MFDHVRTGMLLMWCFMAAVTFAVGIGIWLENARARFQRQAETADELAKAAEQKAWDDFWVTVVRDNYTVAELNALYAIVKAAQ